ncbi:MAG: M1 family peptidase [Calditrichaeota bacterium]|nr:MAG: M1 family peptidase [Calditrichota bacterium]
MIIRNGFILQFFLYLAIATLSAQPVIFENPLSPRIANYDIDVELDTSNRMLHGRETLTWFNKTDTPVQDLHFHLYLNAFRNSQSTFMIESGGRHRSNLIDKDGWGYIDIDSITIDGSDVSEYIEFLQPDTDHPHDKTVCRIPLFHILKPGQSVNIEIEFTAKLPTPPFARTGAKAEYFFAGQWFPKIGVFENGVWNCHQFHVNTEFYADFGVYDVRINVPAGNIVGATGLEVEIIENENGTATHVYHAEDVHDFAWTTSPNFVEFRGREQDVDIRVLMQSDMAYQGERHLEAAKFSVRYFQDWYGDYPFPNLTVVDPRRGAFGSGGMEYPTLITAGTIYGLPAGVYLPELVILHEFGHNYWYHLLASNEFEEAWLDEGINSYTEAKIMDHIFNDAGAINMGAVQLSNKQFHRLRYLFFADYDPMLKHGWKYYSGSSYGANSYSRPAVILLTLDNYLGADVMRNAMQEYVKEWSFKHPKTNDFINVISRVAGQDLNWYFDQILYSNATLDYSVASIYSREVKKNRGVDFDDLEENATSDSLEVKEIKQYESGIGVRRLGEFIFPVEIELTFADGEKIREKWDGKDLWKRYKYVRESKLISATVDPEQKILIDMNFSNNSRTLSSKDHGLKKVAIRMLFWLQSFLEMPELLIFPFSLSR